MNLPSDAPPPQGPRATFDLGYGPMDAIHHEFDHLMAKTQQGSNDKLLQHLEQLAIHLRRHFGAENDWMNNTGFPARDCHLDEHGAVLKSLDEVLPLVAAGDHAVGRRFATELAHWFPGHADYLDSALAHWMCKQQYGGKPVVLTPRLPRSQPQGPGR